MLGIKPASEDVASVQIVIEKIGEYTPVEIPTVTYENKAELKDFTVPEGATIGDYVNVYDEQTHTAVPGADGYFHLDSADGPILLVDLDYLYHLADALNEGRGTMFVSGTDENGNPVRFDIGAACKAYDYVSDENGYYPLTIDLMFFYKEYGAAQGVYSWALNEDPQNPGYNPDSAWMFACLTMTLPEDESSKTGESFHMGAVIAALALSAAACAAVVINKKRFF